MKGKPTMKRTLPLILTPFLITSILLISGVALGQTIDTFDNEPADVDDSAPVARVARLSFVDGDVSFLRAGVTEWAPGVENLPLLTGDQIFAGRGARAEVQLDRGNYIRLSENTELTIADFSDTSAQFEITEGTAIILVERLSTAFHRFEMDTPNTAVVLKQDGLYRIDVRSENDSELIVRRGDAEASTDEGTFRVREGHRLAVDTATGGKLELALDTTRDGWDQWSYDRDTIIARTSEDLAPDYVTRVETDNNDLYGVSDLSSYGTWTKYSSYGQCWIPRVGSDWAPYRSGEWIWIPAAGWTWLSSEPWGWAPYHYGRWAYLSGLGWAWVPGLGLPYSGFGYRDYHWCPALVFFFNSPTPRGNYIGWYPLAPGERWRRPDHRGRDDRAHLPTPTPPDSGRVRFLPAPHRGMTILPVEGFTGGDRSARPAAPNRELAGWINKGARAGLPDIKPSPVAIAPALSENDRGNSHRIAVPSNEIIRRPVVTRTPNAASTQKDVKREHRLISPLAPGATTRGAALVDHGTDRRNRSAPAAQDGATVSGDNQAPKVRLRLPAPTPKVTDDSHLTQRKEAGNGAATADKPSRKSQGSTGNDVQQTQPSATPAAKEKSSADKQNENDARSRDRKPPANEAKTNDDVRQRTRSDEPARARDNSAPTPRAEPKQERPAPEPRQERQQEKQERQQQPEQRKKP